MNRKFLRKLVPAFATLLVAVVVMSTASYAWFTMNKEAKVNGIDLQAKAVGDLMVAYGSTITQNAAGWSSVVTLSDYLDFTGYFLSPSSSSDGKVFFATNDTGINATGGAAGVTTLWKKLTTADSMTALKPLGGKTAVGAKGVDQVPPVGTDNATEGSAGYYLDIPLSFKTVSGAEAWVVIDLSNATKTGFKELTIGKSLTVACRFAFNDIAAREGSSLTVGNAKDATKFAGGAYNAKLQYRQNVAGGTYYPSGVLGPIATDATLTGTATNGYQALTGTEYQGANNATSFMDTTTADAWKSNILFYIPEGNIVTVTLTVWVEGQALEAVDANAGALFNFFATFTTVPDPTV